MSSYSFTYGFYLSGSNCCTSEPINARGIGDAFLPFPLKSVNWSDERLPSTGALELAQTSCELSTYIKERDSQYETHRIHSIK